MYFSSVMVRLSGISTSVLTSPVAVVAQSSDNFPLAVVVVQVATNKQTGKASHRSHCWRSDRTSANGGKWKWWMSWISWAYFLPPGHWSAPRAEVHLTSSSLTRSLMRKSEEWRTSGHMTSRLICWQNNIQSVNIYPIFFLMKSCRDVRHN